MDNMGMLFLISFVVIFVMGFLLRVSAKLVLVGIIIFALFGLGFVWGPTDLNDKLGLSKYLTPQSSQQVNETYSEFTEKRDKYGTIINQDQLKQTYETTETTAKTTALSWYEKAKTGFLTTIGVIKEKTEAEVQAQLQAEIQKSINTQTTPTQTPTTTSTP